MSATLLAADLTARAGMTGPQRLAVAWQHPTSRAMSHVGLLTYADGGYTFDYLQRAPTVPDFQPFLGFEDLTAHYASPSLFPLFAQRVMRPARPDFARYVDYLALGTQTDEWSILARSHGQREGDGIRVYAEPPVDDHGIAQAVFFVSGIRHRLTQDDAVAPALASLSVGDQLAIRDEPDNPVDSQALLVTHTDQVPLAWIPNVLLPHVHTVRATGELELRVAAVHGPDVPPAYRLLVHLAGRVPTGYRAYDGPGWALASEAGSGD
jgi:hypothetical protein